MRSDTWKNIDRSIVRVLGGTSVPPVLFYLFFVHFLFIVMQLHSFPGFSLLGVIRLPGVISFILCFVFVPFAFRIRRHLQVKLYIFVLFVEAVRGVLGYTVFPSWVVNDKWQFEIWQLLLIYFLTLFVPLVTIYSNGRGIRLIILVFVYMGGLLGVWSITHAGFGPGGYLHDENDNCLLLVSLLPYPFFLFGVSRSNIARLLHIICAISILFGIIVTRSRGGYLGLFAVLGMFFLMSRRKGLWVLTALIIGLGSLPFIPSDFWWEIKTIQIESQQGSGTIQERLNTWKIITRMWLSPANTLFGVGLENSRFNLGDYEDSAAGLYVKSLRGRATHSFYFQVLGDLGLYGVLVFLTLIINSLLMLRKVSKESVRLEELLSQKIYQKESGGRKAKKNDFISNHSYRLLKKVHNEMVFIRNLSPVIISSWIGMLVSATGISVAYYPPFWLYCALSLSIYIYFNRIRGIVEMTLDSPDE